MNLLLLLALAACTPDDKLPTCDPAPSSAWSGDPVFEDRTDAWGVTGAEGGRLQAVDLDGDRYPDLVVSQVFSNARDDLAAGTRYHHVLMNRAAEGGGRTFVDETEASGLIQNRDGGVGTSATVFVYGDVDGDGDLDAFAGRYYDAGTEDLTGDCSEILLNDGAGRFTLAPQSDPCDPAGVPVTAASFTDYDADGVLDLWAVSFYEEYGALPSGQDQVYRGNGDGTFTAVTDDVGLTLKRGRSTEDFLGTDVRRPGYGATACDLDGDALPELLASNYGRAFNQLWRNDGGAFTEIGADAGWAADENHDYTDNYWYACWYASNGAGGDPEPTVSCNGAFPDNYWTPGWDDQPARLGGNTFTTVCADIDNDGDNDLYDAAIVHDWAGQSADRSQLLLNDGSASFDRVDNDDNGLARERPQRRSWNEGDLHAAFFDFDNDGWKDIVLGSSDYEDTQVWLWRQVSPGQFEDVSDATGLNHPWPAGMAIADFDLDGDLDFVTGSSTARSGTPWTTREVHFYENTAPVGNWIRLEGLPVGVRVDLTAGGVTQTQEVSGGYGHAGIQNDTALHFGLGEACLVEEIVATWPGGATKRWDPVVGNQALVLE
ncbi:MAG: CRTAC1 family protein [Myxococcota bacterium]